MLLLLAVIPDLEESPRGYYAILFGYPFTPFHGLFFELQESRGPTPRSCGLKVLFSFGTYGTDYPLTWLQTLEKCISQSHNCENYKEESHLNYFETKPRSLLTDLHPELNLCLIKKNQTNSINVPTRQATVSCPTGNHPNSPTHITPCESQS
jgi:hypothetical protein